ncbi:hypothetical protein RSAG8_05647, partial [Rhizoctonia solani AG-8 WAC10335]
MSLMGLMCLGPSMAIPLGSIQSHTHLTVLLLHRVLAIKLLFCGMHTPGPNFLVPLSGILTGSFLSTSRLTALVLYLARMIKQFGSGMFKQERCYSICYMDMNMALAQLLTRRTGLALYHYVLTRVYAFTMLEMPKNRH